ncbi:NAD(P)-binding protein [Ramaria rubella]|nr:NAD(P)-binding protein [Ramaria rubella]
MPSINDSQCVLVIGATAGIGRALALAIHSLPSQPTVIVAGRRQERLDELVEEGKKKGGRLEALRVDVSAIDQLKQFVENVTQKFPQLDTVIFSSGVQHRVDFTNPSQASLDLLTTEFNTNYVSVLTLTSYFLPHLLNIASQGRPTFIIPISSFLAIIPAMVTPGYCATKAAVHSLCLSLRLQLKDKGVHVVEIIPPLVESELHDHQGNVHILSKIWMPLDTFTKETMAGLERGDHEIYPLNQKNYDRFEKGKIEIMENMFAARRATFSKQGRDDA